MFDYEKTQVVSISAALSIWQEISGQIGQFASELTDCKFMFLPFQNLGGSRGGSVELKVQIPNNVRFLIKSYNKKVTTTTLSSENDMPLS